MRTIPGKSAVSLAGALPCLPAEAEMRAPPRPMIPRAYRMLLTPVTSVVAPLDVVPVLPARVPIFPDHPLALPPRPLVAGAYPPILVSEPALPRASAPLARPVLLPIPPRPLSPLNYPAWVPALTTEVPAMPVVQAAAPVEITAPPPMSPSPLPAALPPAPKRVYSAPPPIAAPRPPIAPVAAPAPVLRVETARRPAELAVPRESSVKLLALKCAKISAYAFAGYMAFVVALIVVYRFVNPPMSSLMLQQRLFGQDVMQDWVAMDAISPQIVRAVLLSEDGRFCQHHGVDLLEMQAAIERAQDGIPRGASTISMQVIKNLFLWPSKSFVRKAIEIPLTLAMELLWPKRRIMEVYLNIAEWGPGIFGVESASRFHFDKAASRLNEREAAQLAVALPNPYSRDPGAPGPKTRRLAGDIQDRMRGAYPSQTACVLTHRRGP